MAELSTLPPYSQLEKDQRADLFPAFAYQDAEDGEWRIPVAGFTYRQGEDSMRQRVFLRLIKQLLGVDADLLNDSPVFQERIRGFLDEPNRASTVVVRFHGDDHASEPQLMRKSRRNGHFKGHCKVSREAAQRLGGSESEYELHRVRCAVMLPPDDPRQMQSTVELVPKRGVSVISDIDDTIKITEVAHRRQLLHNTFLNPFAAVPGMAELYQRWAQQGAAFHYVSSSPWQLYRPLAALFDDSRFPEGSFHLRTMRFGDPSLIRLFTSRRRNKYQVIKTIFRLYPQRRFVLVGDSGEKDPEIYGTVARKFPEQIERIIIRRVPGRRWTRKRVAKAFHKIPRELWQTFRVPTQIEDVNLDP